MSFVDTCLTCEKLTSGAAYCSQVCRLQDIDSSSTSSAATSPTYSLFPTTTNTTATTTAGPASHSQPSNPSGNGFFLPPPIDWSALRNNARASGSRSTASSRPTSLCFVPGSSTTSRSHNRAPSSPRGLTPSSSQASLSSMHSSMLVSENLSRQAREELREYTSSFDQVRDLRRRMTAT